MGLKNKKLQQNYPLSLYLQHRSELPISKKSISEDIKSHGRDYIDTKFFLDVASVWIIEKDKNYCIPLLASLIESYKKAPLYFNNSTNHYVRDIAAVFVSKGIDAHTNVSLALKNHLLFRKINHIIQKFIKDDRQAHLLSKKWDESFNDYLNSKGIDRYHKNDSVDSSDHNLVMNEKEKDFHRTEKTVTEAPQQENSTEAILREIERERHAIDDAKRHIEALEKQINDIRADKNARVRRVVELDKMLPEGERFVATFELFASGDLVDEKGRPTEPYYDAKNPSKNEFPRKWLWKGGSPGKPLENQPDEHIKSIWKKFPQVCYQDYVKHYDKPLYWAFFKHVRPFLKDEEIKKLLPPKEIRLDKEIEHFRSSIKNLGYYTVHSIEQIYRLLRNLRRRPAGKSNKAA